MSAPTIDDNANFPLTPSSGTPRQGMGAVDDSDLGIIPAPPRSQHEPSAQPRTMKSADDKHVSAYHPKRGEGPLSSEPQETLRCAQGDGHRRQSDFQSSSGDGVELMASIRPGSRNQNPAGIGFLSLLREDLATHDGNLFEQGFWAVAVHRFGNWRMGLPRAIRLPFTLLYRFGFKWVEWTCGITLPYTVKLGRRVRIWHHSGMVLHAQSIGDDVHIRQNTTFGIARKDALHQLPVIEDRVDLGCGVVVLGRVTIGHDSMIGANAVVLKDVPPGSVAVGVPAKVVKSCQPTTQLTTGD